MSLATDILKIAENMARPKPAKAVRPVTEISKTKAAKPNRRQFKVPEHDHIKGVSFHKTTGGWEAFTLHSGKTCRIGVFATQARAYIALRLFNFWVKQGFGDIPTKPSRRLYTKW